MSRQTMKILSESTNIFSVLSDQNRQQILILLFDNGEMTVNQITKEMSLSRPAVSHHLKLLFINEIVKYKQLGTERFYYVYFEKALVLLKSLINSLETDIKKMKK